MKPEHLQRSLLRSAGLAAFFYGLLKLSSSAYTTPFRDRLFDRPIQESDLEKIKHTSEKAFAEAILKIPYLLVEHEPHAIHLDPEERENLPEWCTQSYTPCDFRLTDIRTEVVLYVEATWSKHLESPKKKSQQAFMDAAELDAYYIQLHQGHIKKLQEAEDPEKVLEELTSGLIPKDLNYSSTLAAD